MAARDIPHRIGVGLLSTTLVVGCGGMARADSAPTTGAQAATGADRHDATAHRSELRAGRYIVTFAGQPAATYRGGIPGLSATAPRAGGRLAAGSIAVTQYVDHLRRTKRQTLNRLGVRSFTDYSLVLNGAAMDLTATQARRLAADPAVLSLSRDRLLKVQTNHSPQFLGLPELWNRLGGQERAGAGKVIGVLDSGIWPESESFRDDGLPTPSSFTGTCQTGQDFTLADCNGKIVGARYYLSGFGRKNLSPKEHTSPRDGEGHGTHTASTAAGRRVDNVTVDGRSMGSVSGMAPGARIAAYKVCWTGRPGVSPDGCTSSDVVAAVDDAVADGVDVINFSVGNASETPATDPQELAFLNAAAAGVFVSASAGNSGPDASTLDHPSPWVTTVAASTHTVAEQTLVLGDGRRFVGASATGPLPNPTPMVLAQDAPSTTRTPEAAALCLPGSLDRAKVRGRLVVCLRGENPRAEKSSVVKAAGGVGMVLINPSTNSLNADLHHLPSVHLQSTALKSVREYVHAGSATGRILALNPGESTTRAPEVAEFSSRGPSTTTNGDILKPDVAAPGVDVLAAVTPDTNHGRNYDAMSGTSMAAPHVAGIAALLMQAHPGWTPMMIKSALMTTARDMASPTGPFAQGAGNIRPSLATDPGVVFTSGVRDWVAYLKAAGALRDGAYPTIRPVRASDLNQASVAVGSLAGSTTVRRTLTSVSDVTETYRFSAAVPGIDAVATPNEVTLAPGESRTVAITLRRAGAPLDKWATGNLRFDSGRHSARLPVAVRPVLASATPAEITAATATGSRAVTVRAGTDGTLTTAVHGLVGAAPIRGTVKAGSFDPAAPKVGPATTATTITVPKGSAMLRVDTAMTTATDDLDLYLYRIVDGHPELVTSSTTATGSELIELPDPKPGTYRAYVNGYSITGDGAYTLRDWVVPGGDAGNLVVTPASAAVRQGENTTLTLRWKDLDRAKAWYGLVDHRIDGREGATTSVLVDEAP